MVKMNGENKMLGSQGLPFAKSLQI